MSLLKEIIWDRHLLSELGYPQLNATPSRSDNDGVITQSTKAVNHAAAKHYRIAQAFIRQICSDGVAVAVRVDTEFNPSDLGTKPLSPELFLRHRATIMGPQRPPPASLFGSTEGKCQ